MPPLKNQRGFLKKIMLYLLLKLTVRMYLNILPASVEMSKLKEFKKRNEVYGPLTINYHCY